MNAPPTSPLIRVDIEDVGLFIIQLTREDFLQTRDSEGTSVHDSMAFTLCNQIISSPDSGFTKSLSDVFENHVQMGELLGQSAHILVVRLAARGGEEVMDH